MLINSASNPNLWRKRVCAALEEIHDFQDEDKQKYGPNDTIARLRHILQGFPPKGPAPLPTLDHFDDCYEKINPAAPAPDLTADRLNLLETLALDDCAEDFTRALMREAFRRSRAYEAPGEAKADPPAVSLRDLSLMDEAIRRCAIEFEGARFSAAWTRIKSTLVPPVAETTRRGDGKP